MNRRKFLVNSAALAAAMPAAVRASSVAHPLLPEAAAAKALAGGTKPVLHCLFPEGSQSNIDAVLAQWTRQTGLDVTFETESLDDINGRILSDSLTGMTTYDVALPATFGIADLVHGNALQPFDALAPAGLAPALGPQVLYSDGDFVDGARYGFQTDGDVYLAFYRKDLAEQANATGAYAAQHGYPLATPDTWAELDRQMAFFHDPTEGCYGGALFRNAGYLAWEYLSRLNDKGARIIGAGFEPNFGSDAAVEALEDMIRATAFLHPATATSGLFENWDLYRNTKIYANVGWGGSQKMFNVPGSPLRGNMIHAQLPAGQGRSSAYFNWGWSYVIPRAAKLAELGYLFARFAVSDSVSTLAVREAEGYFDPFNEVHYADPVIEEVYSSAFLKVHRAAMRNASLNLYVPGYSNYMNSLNEYLALAIEGTHRPEVALELAASEWRLITLEVGQSNQHQRWSDLKAID